MQFSYAVGIDPPQSVKLRDVESIVAKAFGGADSVSVSDLSGTSVTSVVADLAAVGGGDDLAADSVRSTPRTATTP